MRGSLGLGVALVVAAACADDRTAAGDNDTDLAAAGSDSGSIDDDGWSPPDTANSADDANVPAQCGDGIVSVGEQCDGDDVGGKRCASFGWGASPGGLRCGEDCRFDLTSCTLCGNNVIDPGEDCEFRYATCEEVLGRGYVGEIITCTDCKFGPIHCSRCGDGNPEGLEECDGGTIGPAGFEHTCDGYFGVGTPGEVVCTASCEIDLSGCDTCGNNNAEPDEQCDTFDLEGLNCESFGFYGGNLRCNADCQGFDTSQCHNCGDGVLAPEAGEVCDGADLDGASCKSLGFSEGTLSCGNNCRYDLTDCRGCGDGAKGDDEQCDGDDLGGLTCKDFSPSTPRGKLACTERCTLDGSGCIGLANKDR